jgi:hypothetical protein
MKKTCDKCKYAETAGDAMGKFVCKRYPPTVSLERNSVKGNHDIHTQYPIVLIDWWCGEFKRRWNFF